MLIIALAAMILAVSSSGIELSTLPDGEVGVSDEELIKGGKVTVTVEIDPIDGQEYQGGLIQLTIPSDLDVSNMKNADSIGEVTYPGSQPSLAGNIHSIVFQRSSKATFDVKLNGSSDAEDGDILTIKSGTISQVNYEAGTISPTINNGKINIVVERPPEGDANTITITAPLNIIDSVPTTIEVQLIPDPQYTYQGALIQLVIPDGIEVSNIDIAETAITDTLGGKIFSFPISSIYTFHFDVSSKELGEKLQRKFLFTSIKLVIRVQKLKGP